MERVISFFKMKWVLETIAIVLLALLIWFIAPLISVAGNVWLESEFSRWLTIGIIIGLWSCYQLIVLILARKRENQLVADLTSSANQTLVSDEHQVLQKGFEEAMALLKNTSAKASNRQYLYDLPWYAIIGAPGAGKTTALINSGLHFPLAERLGKHSVKGVSGTRDCDWWFADEAVLLDTAGRYTTQDSFQSADASAWHSFLQLLKKYRPRRPLNGVFVAISLTDLLRQTEEELRLHANTIRQRIMELNSQLGVQLPVYLLLTKTDLVAGFSDFFASLTDEERQQVWGETLPLATNSEMMTANIEQFAKGYDDLIERLLQLRFKRMQDEQDIQRRLTVFDFPQQMRLLKPIITQFLSAVFSVNRYEEPLLLRGVYFTSGTQEGTPIDRVMTALASSFKLDRQVTSLLSGRGKTYFLGKLLKQVVFQESDLVSSDPIVERRYRTMRLFVYACTSGVLLLAMLVWMVSFTSNKILLADVEKQIEEYRVTPPPATDSRSNFLNLLPKLNSLASVNDIYEQSSWRSGLGLYQGDKITAGANIAYERLLREGLLTAVVYRLKERMQHEEGNNTDVLLQLFRVYLMLGEPSRIDSKVIQSWVRLDWERMFATEPETLAQLTRHLDSLLALQLDKIELDSNFIVAVRNKLTQVPLVNQVYSRFKNDALIEHDRDLSIAAQLLPNGNHVYMAANGKGLESIIVPGLFTSYGYTDWFLKKGLSYVKDANQQNWVLGTAADNNPMEIERLYSDFKRLYLADYQKVWADIITNVKFQVPTSTPQLIDNLDLLSRPDSPLKLLLETVEKHTSLTKIANAAADALAKTPIGGTVTAATGATDKLISVARQADIGIDPVKLTEAYFEPYNQQVRSMTDRQAPIMGTLASIKNLHDYLMQIGSAANVGGQALSTQAAMSAGGAINPLDAAKMEFARLPGPLANSLNILTNSGGEQLKSGAKNQLNELLKTAVTLPCKSALDKRYPFNKNSAQDVLMADFAKMFAIGGILDQFFNSNLKTFVDTASIEWNEMQSDKALGLVPDSIKQFQTAAKIRDAFFSAGSTAAQVQFELKPVMLDSRIGTFRLNIEGQELVYRHGPEQLFQFKWPGPINSSGVRIVFEGLDGSQVSRSKEGAWALFRMFDQFNIEPTASPDRFFLNIQIDSYTARFELHAASVNNPFAIQGYQTFHCPEVL